MASAASAEIGASESTMASAAIAANAASAAIALCAGTAASAAIAASEAIAACAGTAASPGVAARAERRSRRPFWPGVAGVAVVLATAAAALGAATPAAWARQVTLPLAQYEELRARARLVPPAAPGPPAPFTVESDEVEIVVGPASAAVVQRLTVRLLSGDWQSIPLGAAGSLVSADLGGLEGHIDGGGGKGGSAAAGGSVLQARGAGEHRLRLESAVAVAADETATRPAWRFGLLLPPAAVVRGTVSAAPALAGKVEEAAFAAGALLQPGSVAGRWSFAGQPGRELQAALLGRAVLPERARLALRFEATSASAAVLSHSRLRVHAWVQARVAQGRLPELRLRLPEGLTVDSVGGSQVAGWKVGDGTLAVTPLAPAEEALAVTVELSGAAGETLAAPLVPLGAQRTTYLTRAALEGDGLLELADPGSSRTPDGAEAAPLGAGSWSGEAAPEAGPGGGGAAIPGGPRAPVGGGGGRIYLVADAARPPRWHAAWAERTDVLAAQIDRLWVEVAAGEAGRATYQVWALVRNRGSADLALGLPAGFELQLASRDGVVMVPGTTPDRGLAVPLLSREAPQLVHVAGLVPFSLPGGSGELAVPLPVLSAPAARIEMRLLLPGGRAYELADRTREAAAVAPPSAGAGAGAAVPPPAGLRAGGDLAARILMVPGTASALDAGAATPLPTGFVELAASWSALATAPAPLAVHVAARKEKEPWF